MRKKEPISDRVKALREERGLSQTELAEAAGLSPAFLSRLLQGKRELTFEHVTMLAGALKMTVGDLVAGTDAEDIATKWVEYAKFDEAERGRLAALQELELQRKENALLRENIAKLAAAEHAAKELPIVRQALARAQEGFTKAAAERDQANAQYAALYAVWEQCKAERVDLLRRLENAQRQVQIVQEEASRVKAGAGIFAGLSVLAGVLIASDSGSPKRGGRR